MNNCFKIYLTIPLTHPLAGLPLKKKYVHTSAKCFLNSFESCNESSDFDFPDTIGKSDIVFERIGYAIIISYL